MERQKASLSSEKIDQKISKIMRENNGNIFEIHQEKNNPSGASGAGQLLKRYSNLSKTDSGLRYQCLMYGLSQGHIGMGSLHDSMFARAMMKGLKFDGKRYPMFDIKITPRSRCKLHQKISEQIKEATII